MPVQPTSSSTRDTAAIRDLLTAAFNDEELTALCFDCLPEVYEDFAIGMSKGQKIQRLLDYCIRHHQIEQLLDRVRERNPAKYADYAARGEPTPTPLFAYHPSVLTELPDDLRDLILHNRSHELALLLDHVTTHRVTTITGMGGIGKTTLARVLVELRPTEAPPPMWVNFADEPDADLNSLLGKFAGYLGWSELLAYRQERRQPGRGDIARLTDRLAALPGLWIVFDNLESILDHEGRFCDAGLESLFEALLAHQHQARLIVSSRMLPVLRNMSVMASGLGKSTAELRGLSQANGITLLRTLGLDEGSEAQLARLVQRVNGHPLALWLLLTEVQVWGIARLLTESDLWQTGDIAQFAHQLFARLQPAEQRLLASFSVFRQPQPPPLLVALAGGGPAGQQAFRLLLRKSLVSVACSGDPPCYGLHPLVRERVEAEMDPEQRRQAHLVACDHYLSLQLPPASAWRGPEDITPLLEAHHHAIQAGALDRAAAILLEYALPDYLEQWGAQDRLIKLCRQTFGDAPKGAPYPEYVRGAGYDRLLDQGVDHVERARLYRQLGKCARFLDDYERALVCYERGIALFQPKADHRELVRLDRESAFVLRRLGRRSEALERCRRGLRLMGDVRDREGKADKAELHMRAGVILLADASTNAESFEHFEQAHAVYRELGMTARAYESYDNMGGALYARGDYQAALDYFSAARTYYREAGYSLWAAQSDLNVGAALSELGRYEEARDCYQSAFRGFEEIGDQRGSLLSLYNSGEIEVKLGHDEAAISYLEQSLIRSEAIGEVEDRPRTLCLLGQAHARLGDLTRARDRLEQAIVAAEQSESQETRAEAQQLLAQLGGTAG